MHTHTLYTHIHTQIRYPCVVKWWFAHLQTRFSQIFPPYPAQTLAAFHYRFLSSTALSIDKKKIIGLKLSFKHFVTKNAFFAWKSTFQGGCLFRMKGHKCSECRIPSPQSPCWSTCAMVIPCLWFFMIWGCTNLKFGKCIKIQKAACIQIAIPTPGIAEARCVPPMPHIQPVLTSTYHAWKKQCVPQL